MLRISFYTDVCLALYVMCL